LEPDGPDPHAIGLGHQGIADAWVGIVPLALEFRDELRRPRRLVRFLRLLVQHRQGHGIPPSVPIKSDSEVHNRNFKSTALVSRFRSSHHCAARSFADVCTATLVWPGI